MYLDADDHRPGSLLDRAPVSVSAMALGALATVVIHLVLPLGLSVVVALLTVLGVLAAEPPAELPPVENVIQARFLQLGEEIDPSQLPNRRVPILRTDRAQPAPSKRTPNEPVQRQERQRDSIADAIQRLSAESQVFAEREERRIQEGDPEGVEGGDREASEGDLYAGQLSQFFRRGWSVATTLDRDSLRDLTATVSVHVGNDLRVESFRLVRSSGNPDYDLSVTQQLQRLIDAQASIPEPPSEVAFNYVGRDVAFRYHGREAR